MKYTVKELWEERYGTAEKIIDHAGRRMLKAACGDPNSAYHPTLDHIRPLSKGGCDVLGNIEICHRDTNEEKADSFPHWKANGKRFRAERVKGTRTDYKINRTISLLTEIALPSIIQLLQKGVSDKSIVENRNITTLNSGFDEFVLRDRHTLVEYQHRMHSDISAFSAKHIYEGRALKNGNRINRDWGYYEFPKRACWLNVAAKSNCNNNNPEEVKVIISEVKKFISFAKDNPKHNGEPWTIACLTYYRKQEEMLKKELHRVLKTDRASSYQSTADGTVEIMIYTVDKFQGKEADIVFLSMIKSGQAGLGFMDSPNRLNVALTRAKYQMVVVGDKEFFRSNRCKSELLRSVAEEY